MMKFFLDCYYYKYVLKLVLKILKIYFVDWLFKWDF